MASSIERVTIKLPTGFDPVKHERALMKIIAEKHGPGFELDSIDPVNGTASVSRQVVITEVTQKESSDSFEVRLARGTKPTDGEKVEAKMMDQYPGYFMSRFEPFLGKATLMRLSDDEARCRGAVAVALGVKPWDVGVQSRPDGGFDLDLPRTYVGSKHDTKLDEVATDVVGRDGWYVRVNAQKLTASLIPADPPTFPAAIPFPMDRLGKGDAMDTPFGWKLPLPGENVSEVASIDWRASGSALVSGLAGGGKAQPLDAPIPVPVSEKFPSGQATMGDLAVGDEVFSRDRSRVKVTYLSPVRNRTVFAVAFDDGEVVEADGEHLWLVEDAACESFRLSCTVEQAQRWRQILNHRVWDLGGFAGTVAAIADHVRLPVEVVAEFVAAQRPPLAGVAPDGFLYPAAEVVHGLVKHFVYGETHTVRSTFEIAATLLDENTQPRWRIAGDSRRIVSITQGSEKPVRCIAVDHPEHTYLTGNGVATHNTVTITAVLADRVANGAELVIVDTADKAQPLTTRLPVPLSEKFKDGWALLGDIEVGDQVYAPDGSTVDVTALTPVKEDAVVYEVEFSDGQRVKADAGHLWPVLSRSDRARQSPSYDGAPREYQVLTTEQIAQAVRVGSRGLLNYAVRNPAPVEGVESDLPIAPYILGVWLGDGGEITAGLDDGDELATLLDAEWGSPVRSGGGATFVLPCPDPGLCDHDVRGVAPSDAGEQVDDLCPLPERAGHIPAEYLRASYEQRLALLQGLMDTGGRVAKNGYCTYVSSSDRLAADVLELCRSLGIAAVLSKKATRDGVAASVSFSTDLPVARLARKRARLRATATPRSRYRFIKAVRRVASEPVRCITVDHPDHLYLTEGFVPTHNCVDYLAFKDMCGVVGVDGKYIPGWGCDSLEATVATLAMLCEEGKARAKVLARLGVNNWLDLPPDKAFKPIFIIADEYEALVARVPEPKALPKDHPIRVEAIEENMAHDLISHYMNRIVKEFRFVGLNPLISTQVSNASTGLPPSLKGKMGHFVLCGSTPSEAARRQSFPDASSVPLVPGNVAAGGAVARGTGSAKIEGGGTFVFKSYFAPVQEYRAALDRLGVPTFPVDKVAPTRAQIDEFMPRLDDESSNSDRAPSGGDRAPSGKSAAQLAAEMGDTVGMAMHDGSLGTGFEKANAIRHLAGKNAGKATGKQKAEAKEEAEWAARSGEVTVRQVEPRDTSGDGW